MAVIDSYAISNNDGSITYNPTSTAYGESFTGDGNDIDEIDVESLIASGSPTGNATIEIYAHSGVFGTSSVPTGSILATSDGIDVTTFTGSLATYTFNFSTPYTTVNGTKYVWQLRHVGTAGNVIGIGRDNSSPTHTGNASRWGGSSWQVPGSFDCGFEILSTGGVGGGADILLPPTKNFIHNLVR